MFLTAITLNVNRIHDSSKWQDLWPYILAADVVCFQETHLAKTQEYHFHRNAQKFDFFYSHGTTNSGGVCTGVKWNLGAKTRMVSVVPGHLLTLDMLLPINICVRVINIYTPTDPIV